MTSWFDQVRFPMRRLQWVRSYYMEQHLELVLPGCVLHSDQGVKLGYLEELRLYQGRLYLRGWTLASELSIRLGATQIKHCPREEREDVAQALGCDRHVGFRASLPFEEGQLQLDLYTGHEHVRIRHKVKIKIARQKAKLRLAWRFWRETIPLLPMIVRGLRQGDTDLPRRIKVALRLGPVESGSLLEAGFLRPEASAPSQGMSVPRQDGPQGFITVILPIYNAFDLLPETLSRVMRNTDLPFRLILIEDGSPDTRVRPWLRDWITHHQKLDQMHTQIELVENPDNLGFIGAVNRGFTLAQEKPQDGSQAVTGPVILLNSDAMVPANWASRLVAPLADPSIASVTPLSNDAEIFTAPVICARHDLSDDQGDAIDAALSARVSIDAPSVKAPTGVGFCMALSRDWLERLGGFDASFGRGYGEEVDWCRRADALGGAHVVVPGLFVEHRGGASFGAEKLALVQKHNGIITARYPNYDRLVQEFIRTDPLITARLVAALAWADSLPDLDTIPVYIGHSMGGGAENYLQDRIRADKVSIVLRLGGMHRCRIEMTTPQGRLVANSEDLGMIVQLLAPISKRRVIYSCAVGDPDLGALPDFLQNLAKDVALEILFHDYLPLSPSYTLLDKDGVYRGLPDPMHPDSAHQYRRPNGETISLASWQAAWSEVITMSERVHVFSESSAEIVMQAYPQAAEKLRITPHRLSQEIPVLTLSQTKRVVIAALGAIGPQKGAAVLSALSKALPGRKDMDLVLIGRIAPGYPLASGTLIHGSYAIEDIPHLAQRYKVTHWLIPSIWPETFSYTVHECLATGLPTLAFDLGAQGDAVRQAGNGILLPWLQGKRSPEDLAQLICTQIEKAA